MRIGQEQRTIHKIGCHTLLFIGVLFVGIGIYAVLFNNNPLFVIMDTFATWLAVDAVFTIAVGQNRFLPITLFFAVLFLVPLAMTGGVLKRGAECADFKGCPNQG